MVTQLKASVKNEFSILTRTVEIYNSILVPKLTKISAEVLILSHAITWVGQRAVRNSKKFSTINGPGPELCITTESFNAQFIW